MNVRSSTKFLITAWSDLKHGCLVSGWLKLEKSSPLKPKWFVSWKQYTRSSSEIPHYTPAPRRGREVYCFTSVRLSVRSRYFSAQASYRYTILWVAFLDPSDSYFLFADLVGFYTHWTYMLIFRHIFLSNYWCQISDILSQASYRYAILWEAILDPSDSYFLFVDFVDFYTFNIHLYMHIFCRIFLSNYWWQKSDIWSQASYRYPISWEVFFDPSDTYFLFAEEH